MFPLDERNRSCDRRRIRHRTEAIATLFAKQGARVYVLELDANAGPNSCPRRTRKQHRRVVDATCRIGVGAGGVRRVYTHAGRIILVNNAGIAHISTVGPPPRRDLDRIQRQREGRLPLLPGRHPKMIHRGGGVSSTSRPDRR